MIVKALDLFRRVEVLVLSHKLAVNHEDWYVCTLRQYTEKILLNFRSIRMQPLPYGIAEDQNL